MLESCSWLAQIQQKKICPKKDGLGPSYKKPCGVGVHVDISTNRQEGVNNHNNHNNHCLLDCLQAPWTCWPELQPPKLTSNTMPGLQVNFQLCKCISENIIAILGGWPLPCQPCRHSTPHSQTPGRGRSHPRGRCRRGPSPRAGWSPATGWGGAGRPAGVLRWSSCLGRYVWVG